MAKLIDWILRIDGLLDIAKRLREWWGELSPKEKEDCEKELYEQKKRGVDEKTAFINIMLEKNTISLAQVNDIRSRMA